MKRVFLLLFSFYVAVIYGKDFNILDFGAVSIEGKSNTIAIQNAIDSCILIGGGRVIIPAGTFITGSVELKTNVELFFEEGAQLMGSADLSDYPYHRASHKFVGDSVKLRSLIWADNAENIKICGYGIIDGQGASESFSLHSDKKVIRPMVLRMINCRNIKIENITLKNSPMWMQQYVACRNLSITGIQVHNHVNKHNDGLDIVGCSDVLISDCRISSDDDGICLKTLSDAENNTIVVSNCIIASNCNALKIGTETRSANRNIIFTGCVVKKSGVMSPPYKRDIGMCGVAIESVDGGIVENIVISDISISGVYTPLFVRLGNRARRYTDEQEPIAVGSIKNISFSNIIGTAERAPEIAISGIPGYDIENISFSNINLTMKGGLTEYDFSSKISEVEDHYPEVKMFGPYLPAYALFIRHVNGIQMSGIRIQVENPDVRPAIMFDDVKNAVLQHIFVDADSASRSVLQIRNCSNFQVYPFHLKQQVSVFLMLEGEFTNNIYLPNSHIIQSDILYKIQDGANEKALIIR